MRNLQISADNIDLNYMEKKENEFLTDIISTRDFSKKLSSILNKRTMEFKRESVKISSDYGKTIFESIKKLDENYVITTGKDSETDLFILIDIEIFDIHENVLSAMKHVLHSHKKDNSQFTTEEKLTKTLKESRNQLKNLIVITNECNRNVVASLDELLLKVESTSYIEH